jgi:hypothetical protein
MVIVAFLRVCPAPTAERIGITQHQPQRLIEVRDGTVIAKTPAPNKIENAAKRSHFLLMYRG